jgi:hypothetical protein
VDYTPTRCNVPFAGIPLSGGAQQSGTLNLSFDANGESDFSAYSFNDASLLELTASAVVNDASLTPTSVQLNVVPAYLSMSTTHSGLITAGINIPLTVAAYGSANTVLPGYQSNLLQVSAQRIIPDSVDASDAQFYFGSSNAVNTSLSSSFSDATLSFTNGASTVSDAYFEEVGTYQLDVRDSNYLGTQINATPLTLDRVIPAYFDVQKVHQPVLQNTCNANFTYVGETFTYVSGLEPSYEISAYNALVCHIDIPRSCRLSVQMPLLLTVYLNIK